MTFDTVRKLMDTTIRPWLLENGLVPEIPKVCHPRGVDRMIWYGFYLNFTNTLARWEDVGIKVTGILTVIGSQSGVDEIGREYEYETIKNFKYQLKPVGKWAGIAPYSMLQIPVGNLAYQFIGVIWGTDVQEKWWKKFNQLHME
jgi:hypothetical protein